MSNNSIYSGLASVENFSTEYNQMMFTIKQNMLQMQTSIPVQVINVYPNTLFTGYVDIQPLVQQLAADGTSIDHGILSNVPYFRLQGGSNAIIIDPVAGDIGIACFASRDISSVKSSRKKSPATTKRSYDFSDGMYIGGILNGTPTQFIKFTESGINITTPGTVTINGNLSVTGTITNGSVNMTTHKHSDPQGGTTGGPQ